jgi:3-hydroxy-9,10-secoandrosta-1,3,5(10)-triene-9,17-dione monooxygenase
MPLPEGVWAQAEAADVDAEFVAALARRADEAERLRILPADTISDFKASGLATLLLPERFGGRQAQFSQLLDPVRRMAHGCASSAWTLGFYTLHNWMLSLFDIPPAAESWSTAASG